MYLDHIIKTLKSDPAYWIVQNTVGLVVPLLFGIVGELRFPMACIASVFYGITSQTLTNNTSIGARIKAGCQFMGAMISGGLIGFAIVSLSWLARGSGVQSLLEIADKLQKPSFGDYFRGDGDFYDAIYSVYKDVALIIEADTTSVSTAYWVLVLVLFAILTTPWAWMRSTSHNSLTVGVSIISFTLTLTVASFALMMPISGQYEFWTSTYGGFLKATCVSMLGTFLSGLIIYVRSAHDEVRKIYARAIRDAGRTLSHVVSCMQEAMDASASDQVALVHVSSKSLQHIGDYDKKIRTVSVKNYLQLLHDLQASNAFLFSCKTEPALPGFSSQWGSNEALYEKVGESIELCVSQIGCVEVIYQSIRKNLKFDEELEDSKRESLTTSEDMATRLKIMESIKYVSAGIASVFQGSSDALARMPFFQACSGNSIQWRPKSKEFWLDLYHNLFEMVSGDDTSMCLKKSGLAGIKEILEIKDLNSMPFCLGGSSLVLFTAVENMIDYCVQLDQRIAVALDITDHDAFDPVDIHTAFRQSLCGEKARQDSEKFYPKPSSGIRSNIHAIQTSPIFKVTVFDVFLGTGLYAIFVYFSGYISMMKQIKTLAMSPWTSKESKQKMQGPTYREIVYFFKYWSGIVLLVVAEILIGWLAVGNTDSNLNNQQQTSEYLMKWMPFNAPLAAAICLNTTVDGSIIKIFLRASMIALGGVLGYVTMLNGTLAQNAYFVFWMNMLVNAFFSYFSSIDYYSKYSMFLLMYTYFGVVVCQYSGQCCQPGDVWEFAGRTITTIIGAAFALALNWLVMPVYVSQAIFAEEVNLLHTNMGAIEKSLEQGPRVLLQKQLPESSNDAGSETMDTDENVGGNKKPVNALYDIVSEKTERSFQRRLSLANQILAEKKMNSIDDWRLFAFYVTLIPLPLACKQAFARIARMGFHINVYMHALKSSIYPKDKVLLSEEFLSTMREGAFKVLNATQELSVLIADLLMQTSRDKNSKTEIKIISELDLIMDVRRQASKEFEAAITTAGGGIPSIRDLKCLVFYQYVFASLDEVHRLGMELCKDENMKIRDNYFTFIVALGRKINLLSLEE